MAQLLPTPTLQQLSRFSHLRHPQPSWLGADQLQYPNVSTTIGPRLLALAPMNVSVLLKIVHIRSFVVTTRQTLSAWSGASRLSLLNSELISDVVATASIILLWTQCGVPLRFLQRR